METTNTTCENIPLRAKPPRASVGLNKKAIVLTTGFLSIVVMYAFLGSFNPPTKRAIPEMESGNAYKPVTPVKELPDDYSKIKKLPEPKVREAALSIPSYSKEATKVDSEAEKLLREYTLNRLKRSFAARDADLEFKGISSRQETSVSKASEYPELKYIDGPDSSSQGTFNPRDNDNRQDEKNSFLNTTRSDDFFLKKNLVEPSGRFAVQAGSVIPGVLLTGINSDLPGQISGQVSQAVYDSISGRYLLIPQGTKVIGEYDSKVVYGQERVLIVWKRLIFPNGKSISLEGMPGVDLSGYAGLSDQVNNHYLRLISGVVLGSVIGAGAQVANGNNRYGNPDFSELALAGAADNINKAGQEITRKNLNIQPTLEIRPGYRFNIFVTKDISLESYDN